MISHPLCVFLLLFLIQLSVRAESWQAHRLPRTVIFTQAQLKYTLNPHYSDFKYFSQWTDWPLLIDDALKEKGVRHHRIQYPEFQRIQQVMQLYGLDGIGFWEEHHRLGNRADIIGFTDRSAKENFHLFPMLSGRFDIDRDIASFQKSPHTFRIGGKMVLVDPYSVASHPKTGARFRSRLKEKHGDRFVIISASTVPWAIRSRFYDNGNRICDADKARLARIMADKLAVSDGFGWWDLCTMRYLEKGRRVFNAAFYRALMEYTGEFFRKPEYRDKLFYAEAVVSHANAFRTGYTLSCEGTQTLRTSLVAALENGADIVNIPEWDEQNENTSLRPTVYNGTSQLRVLRYITGRLKKQLPALLPGDDPAIPNLVFSMRKIISLGERLNFELLNLPDRKQAVPFTVQLQLKDIHGRILHRFPVCSFHDREMQEYRPEVPSEKFSGERVLIPELLISDASGNRRIQQGLAAVQIQSTWNFDYHWVKQPLRDLLDAPQVKISMAPAVEEGLLEISASVRTKEELAFAEVLDNYDCVYAAPPPGEKNWREDGENLVFSVRLQSIIPQRYSGTVRLLGTESQWRDGRKELKFRNAPADLWMRGGWVRMPRKDLAKAYFDIDLPGHFTGKIPVSEVMKKRSIVHGGRKGFNLGIIRQTRQYDHPRNLRTHEANFRTEILPDLPASVIQLQLISMQGKIWRSAPMMTEKNSEKKLPVTVFSECLMKPVTVSVPENLVPVLDYDWNCGQGLVVPVKAGRTLWGIRGGYLDLACVRNGGGDSSQDGIPCLYKMAQPFWRDHDNLAAEIVNLPEGGRALRFDGKGEHLSLPKGSIPRRAGFVLSFEMKAESLDRKQYLLANRNRYMGAFSGLFAENGRLHGSYTDHTGKTSSFTVPVPLQEKAWNRVVISYDLKNFHITVNGKSDGLLPAPGPGLYDIPVLIGNWGKESFCGLIRNLRISHSVTELRN